MNKPRKMAGCKPTCTVDPTLINNFIYQKKVLRFKLKKGDVLEGQIKKILQRRSKKYIRVLFFAFSGRKNHKNNNLVLEIPINQQNDSFYVDIPYWFSKNK